MRKPGFPDYYHVQCICKVPSCRMGESLLFFGDSHPGPEGTTGGSLKDSGSESGGYTGATTGGTPRETGAESVGYIGGTTGGTPRETGAEPVGYTGGRTGGSPRDTGAESVGYIAGRRWRRRRRRRSGCHLNSNNRG